jgi:tRNA pseudouridine55 synthase
MTTTSTSMTTDGLAVVDKPAGWTSHDVVAKARGLLGTRKIGHSGTLDPDATGVLLLGVGTATRLLRYLNDLPKTYTGEVVFGTATSTLDASGEVTGTWEMAVTPDDVRAALPQLTGAIEQLPPMVSAVQVDGKRLHDLARQGIEVERQPRAVTVHAFTAEPTDDPLVYRIEVTCSSGTYIRALAADLGTALGGGAHLRALRRTAIGPHTVEVARPLERFADAGELLPVGACVAHLEHVTVDDETAALVAHGRKLRFVDHDGPVAVVDERGELLAVYRAGKPDLVLPSE